jgi:hypothetical protein
VEAYLHHHLSTIPDNAGMHATALRLHQACGAAPLPGALDYVRLALRAGVAHEFNRFLSEESAARLRQGARVWLQLSVLDDRLRRLVPLLEDADSTAELIQVRLPARWQQSPDACCNPHLVSILCNS